MANEIIAPLGGTYAGNTTIVARLVGDDGEIVGSDIALTESGTSSGTFVGDIPGGTARGDYAILIYDTTPNPDLLLGASPLYWTGSREITLGDLQAVQNAARAGV